MIRLIFPALLFTLGYLLLRLLLRRYRRPRRANAEAGSAVTHELVQDPNCHTYLPRSQAIRRKIQGHEYFFCSPACLDTFRADHS
ncbi:MAG: YHS domain-containing protein [Nitrospinae bacterium]|nr:YHS domain-containing protein [Nitrospinota bacterium]